MDQSSGSKSELRKKQEEAGGNLSSAYYLAMKTQVIYSFETSGFLATTRRYNPETHTLHSSMLFIKLSLFTSKYTFDVIFYHYNVLCDE